MKQASPSILIYKFLPALFALRCIESRLIKVSTIDNLNDPFDVCPYYAPPLKYDQKKNDLFIKTWKEILNKKFGIISTSRAIEDPVLWAHYADCHRGIALEFDHILDDSLIKIEYDKKRPVVELARWGPHNHREVMKLILQRKWKSWSYEKEYRSYVELDKCEQKDGLYFWPVPDNFLTRVILGIRCTLDHDYITRTLARNGFKDVEVVNARPSDKEFRIEV